jgi:multiple sugar transport system ATP-binding protein
MAEVVIQNAVKKYSSESTAVDDVSLKVADREFLVLVGPSGCGKSTTLRLIAGLEALTEGEIRIGERVVNEVSPKDRDIAMVFQNYALYPHMSVYKNMAFGLQLRFGGGIVNRGLMRLFRPRRAAEYSALRNGIDERVRQAARRLEIEHLLDRKPHELSGGERQRVALGRAIVREPAAFLFDEPLSNLDAKLRQQMRVELKRLHRELDATMIYVTHDQVEAMTLGDRVAVMKDGKLQQVAPPMEIYEQPANLFVAQFIGSTPINLETGSLEQKQGKIEFRSNRIRVILSDRLQKRLTQVPSKKQVSLGFRAEAVNLVSVDSSENDAIVAVEVVTVDQLGDSSVAHVSVGDASQRDSLWVVRASNEATAVSGQPAGLKIESDSVYLFDTESGNNLLKDQT